MFPAKEDSGERVQFELFASSRRYQSSQITRANKPVDKEGQKEGLFHHRRQQKDLSSRNIVEEAEIYLGGNIEIYLGETLRFILGNIVEEVEGRPVLGS